MSDQDNKQTSATSISGGWLRDYDLGHHHASTGNFDSARDRTSSGYRTGRSDYNAGIRVWAGSVANPAIQRSQK